MGQTFSPLSTGTWIRAGPLWDRASRSTASGSSAPARSQVFQPKPWAMRVKSTLTS